MNAPVFAALAPGVEVSGRMVSAISSSSATSAAVNAPAPCAIACVERRVVERERQQPIAADERGAAEQRGHALHGLAAGQIVALQCPLVAPPHRLPRFSSSTANAAARAVSAM